jgi:lysophospholipid acyltransferase (LPLAT)-like uncharacterized protein
MAKSVLYKYTVNNVPYFLQPLFYLFSYLIAILFFIYALIARFTCKIEILGEESLIERKNYIYCHWHTFTPLYFSVFYRHLHRHVWMQHPLWYMKPVHLVLRFAGMKKITLGSTRYSGRKAADELVECLRKGYSTVIMPDGPSGPAFVPKLGVFHVSLKSNVPIVPMKFNASRFFESRSWDRKKWPIPFSSIKVEFGNPIQVTEENFDKEVIKIAKALG